MKLKNIHGFAHVFDVEITRDKTKINVKNLSKWAGFIQ
jgi:hypothetical protein